MELILECSGLGILLMIKMMILIILFLVIHCLIYRIFRFSIYNFVRDLVLSEAGYKKVGYIRK